MSTNGNGLTPEIKRMVTNAVFSRAQLFRSMLDERRSIDDDCGYPETEEITDLLYKKMYDREAVAARVVEVLPQESWKVQPSIIEDEDPDNTTAFEEAWHEVGKRLQGESWYEDEESNPVWEYLRRADELSGIGSFGVLLIGLDDGLALHEEAKFGKQEQKLLFLRCFDASQISIVRFETDQASPRYGQPVEYAITLGNPSDYTQSMGLATNVAQVHWTRVIHLADNLGNSELFSKPRQRPVWNRLLDLRKLYGGSAEMYWKGAFMGLSIESHPQLGSDVTIGTDKVKAQIEQYTNSLQRYIAAAGVSVKPLAPQVVDPTPQIDAQIKAICIQIGIPKRVFEGSERGELSSTQDMRAWDSRLVYRQKMYLTPRVIVPTVNRMILLGVLPKPVNGYKVGWPRLDSLSEDEQATIAVKRTEAMTKYVTGNVEAIMTPIDYYTRELGYDKEEAGAIIEAVMGAETFTLEDEEEEEEGSVSGESDVSV